jgi:hypothetical protein
MVQNTEGSDIDTVLTYYSGMSSENKPVKISLGLHNEIRTWYFTNIKQEGETVVCIDAVTCEDYIVSTAKKSGTDFEVTRRRIAEEWSIRTSLSLCLLMETQRRYFLIVSLND